MSELRNFEKVLSKFQSAIYRVKLAYRYYVKGIWKCRMPVVGIDTFLIRRNNLGENSPNEEINSAQNQVKSGENSPTPKE